MLVVNCAQKNRMSSPVVPAGAFENFGVNKITF
jgi:hypothetical protein